MLAAVAAVEPGLPAAVVIDVLRRTAASRQALRWLGTHLDTHPGVLIDGPTSAVPVLDRFTRGLGAAGARCVRVIHPACEECGRREKPHASRGRGWVCSACWARASARPCGRCGNVRRVAARGDDGGARCTPCLRRERRDAELGRLASAIAATVIAADASLDPETVLSAVERIAPTLFHRRKLAASVDAATLLVSEHQPVPLARLVADLRAQGATVLAAGRCEDCDAATIEPVTAGSHVRCRACAERCPECAM